MKKKGRFSLAVAIVFLIIGIMWTSYGVLYSLGVLPEAFEALSNTLLTYTSLRLSKTGIIDFGVFLVLSSILIFSFRLRKPFSMVLILFLFVIYYTLALIFRIFMGLYIPQIVGNLELDGTKRFLLVALLLIEILLTFALMPLLSTFDRSWREKYRKTTKRLEKEGLLLSKEEGQAERIRIRQEKNNRIEEKKQRRQAELYERERISAQSKEKRKEDKLKLKEEKKYEKVREKEERRKDRIEEKEREKRLKEEDKGLEREEIKERKRQRKEEKKFKKALKAEKKNRKEKEAEGEPEREFKYERALTNPNSPLEFPDFMQMPKLSNYKPVEPSSLITEKKEELESSTVLEALYEEEKAENEEKQDDIKIEDNRDRVPRLDLKKERFSSGGMLEATLEAYHNQSQLPAENSNSDGSLGYVRPDSRREEYKQSSPEYKEEVKTQESVPPRYGFDSYKKEEGVAPSNLSPEHPRYSMFLSLQRSPEEQKKMEEKAIEERRRESEEHIAPSKLSPDHPRYQYFKALQNNKKPDSQTVSHFPSRPFEAENGVRVERKESYSNLQEDRREREKNESPSQYSQSINSVKKEEFNAFKAEERKTEKPHYAEAKVNTEAFNYESVTQEEVAETPPVNVPKRKEERADGLPEQQNELELTCGIGGLSSNNLGYASVMKRENRLYQAPPLSLLKDYPDQNAGLDEYTRSSGQTIIETYAQQKVNVNLVNIVKGPSVTMFEFQIEPGTKLTKITGAEDELKYALGGINIRILAPIPGKQAIGVEIPNKNKSIVGFKDLVYSVRASESAQKMAVPMILGKDINGNPRTIDVAKMPHMIIAGTTGSGKSVCINAFINTLIYQKGPQDVRLILVDPKVVELSLYNGIPHLLTPVITDVQKVIKVLNFLVTEMERRYNMLARYGVRNIIGYNQKIKDEHLAAERMPYIVLIMDEFADMMAIKASANEIEIQISRLAAKARAAGIHLILATQRPSADVITGTLKSNLPGRIAFAVSSSMNSRIILDNTGAENLLGKGDMLLSDPANPNLQRIQGAFLSDDEVDDVVRFAKEHGGEPDYLDEEIFAAEEDKKDSGDDEELSVGESSSDEALYESAKQVVFERKQASASYLQRRLKLGYNRAARIMDMLEENGIIGPANGSKPREVLKYE